MSFLRYVCHQKPRRCLKFGSWRMPICARCTGFYGGLVLGSIAFGIWRYPVGLPWWVLAIAILSAISPMAVDGLSQILTKRESNNTLRLITGLLAGLAMGLCAVYLVVSIYQMFMV